MARGAPHRNRCWTRQVSDDARPRSLERRYVKIDNFAFDGTRKGAERHWPGLFEEESLTGSRLLPQKQRPSSSTAGEKLAAHR